jgi:hypothetical protein
MLESFQEIFAKLRGDTHAYTQNSVYWVSSAASPAK